MCQRWELCERGKEVHETAGDLRGDVCEGEEGEQGVRVEWVIYRHYASTLLVITSKYR